jgi:hypothetical protein
MTAKYDSIEINYAELRKPDLRIAAAIQAALGQGKQFFVLPGSSHEPSRDSTDLLLKVLLEKVRPLALEHPTER